MIRGLNGNDMPNHKENIPHFEDTKFCQCQSCKERSSGRKCSPVETEEWEKNLARVFGPNGEKLIEAMSPTIPQPKEEWEKQFDHRVNEILTANEYTEEPVEFGFRRVLRDEHGNDNLVTATDWGHVRTFIRKALSDLRLEMVRSVEEGVPEAKTEQKNIRQWWFCAKCDRYDLEVYHPSSTFYCRDCGKRLVSKERGDDIYDQERDGWNSCRQKVLETLKGEEGIV